MRCAFVLLCVCAHHSHASTPAVVSRDNARNTMAYMYCKGVASCDNRTRIALIHSSPPSLSFVVLGSGLCRITEFKAESPGDWCDYARNYSSHVRTLQRAGTDVLLNAAGAHNFATLPFVTGDLGVARMVELALNLSAVGWAFDLEAKGIPLEQYVGFFTKVGAAFAPHGLRIQYTIGKHFAATLNFSALFPLVDYGFDMGVYGGSPKQFNTSYSSVPAAMRGKYVPAGSDAKWTADTAKTMFALFRAAPGVETVGMFAITETTQDFWWPALQQWLSGS